MRLPANNWASKRLVRFVFLRRYFKTCQGVPIEVVPILTDNFSDDITMHVGQSEIPTGVAISQFFVIHAH